MKNEIKIVFEDADFFVIDKPAGLKVHASHPEDKDENLITWLVHSGRTLSRSEDLTVFPYRPGIVHRLDQWTSGLLIIAKNDAIHLLFEKMFLEKSISKIYCALLAGRLKQPVIDLETEIIRDPKRRTRFKAVESKDLISSNSRTAISRFSVLRNFTLPITLSEIAIFTGRTHQIRVHAKYLNCPIFGDDLYGFNIDGYKGLQKIYKNLNVPIYLQAAKLSFNHPANHKKLNLSLDLPNYFKELIGILE